MKINVRAIHRDLGYFYLGLIIAFSISGIALNHRTDWDPMEYTVSSQEISIERSSLPEAFTEETVLELSKDLGFTEKTFQGFRMEENQIRIFGKGMFAELNTKTGESQVESFKKRPVLGQMTQLHKDTDVFWIWYSDIFGVAMLVMAVTGALIMKKGRFSFQERGWKLALVGIIFPLIFLVLFP